MSNLSIDISQKLNALLQKSHALHPMLGSLLANQVSGGHIFCHQSDLSDLFKKFEVQHLLFKTDEINRLFFCKPSDSLFISSNDKEEIDHFLKLRLSCQIYFITDNTFNIQNSWPEYNFLTLDDFKKMISELSSLNNQLFKIDFSMRRLEFTNKALFLDRDGVIIEHIDYLKNASDVKLMTSIELLLNEARRLGYKVIIVTNQSGIGRKIISEFEYAAVSEKVINLLAEKKCFIDDTLEAFYYEKSSEIQYLIRQNFRKPGIGMLLHASEKHQINLEQSILFGDRVTDVLAGIKANLKATVLLKSTQFVNEEKYLSILPPSNTKTYAIQNIDEAISLL